MKSLIVADLHLTDHYRDEYRWEILYWMRELIGEYQINQIVILGDLTEKKDNHSAKLVNTLVTCLHLLLFTEPYPDIHILMGNHDYVDNKTPYFYFVGDLRGVKDSAIHFYDWNDMIRYKEYEGEDVLFIPHDKNNKKYLRSKKFKEYLSNYPELKTIYMHELFNGANFGWGERVKNSLDKELFKKYKVYSGHLHSPQTLGTVTYVGAPYHIDYGDNYEGRVLIIDSETDEEISLFPDFLKKWNLKIKDIEDLDKYDMRKGDQVKIKIVLKQADFHKWRDIKKSALKYCKTNKVELHSIELMEDKERDISKREALLDHVSPKEIVLKYCKQEKLSDEAEKLGLELVKEE